jgi:hypothetical protein
MSMNTEDTTDQTYSEIADKSADLVAKGRDPLEVAAALMALGAKIYRTELDDHGYNTMMDAVSYHRHCVSSFLDEAATLQ